MLGLFFPEVLSLLLFKDILLVIEDFWNKRKTYSVVGQFRDSSSLNAGVAWQ